MPMPTLWALPSCPPISAFHLCVGPPPPIRIQLDTGLWASVHPQLWAEITLHQRCLPPFLGRADSDRRGTHFAGPSGVTRSRGSHREEGRDLWLGEAC